MAVDSGTYDDATLARRAKIAEAMFMGQKRPIQHWTQGLADVANTAVGAYGLRKLDEESRGNQEAADKARLDFLTGGVPQVSANPGVNPMGDRVPVSNVPPDKIYSNDEPSPLDPPSGADQDRAVRTILAEAGNQGPTGMNAVASVIRNRAVAGNYGGDTAGGVVQAPGQFEPWNTAGGRANMAAIDPNSQKYKAAADALSSAYFGNDPTNGATHFFAPKAQAALGRPVPAWGASGGQDIGDHRFFGGKGAVANALGPQPTQVAGPVPTPEDPAALPQNAQPTQGFAIPGQQQQQPDIKGRIAQMLSNPNPAIRKLGRQYADAYIANEQKANAPTDEMKEYRLYQQQGGKDTFFDFKAGLKKAGAQNISIDQRGENAFAKEAGSQQAKRFNEIVTGGQDAQAMVGDINALRDIGGRITTGKQAEITAALGPYAEALGVKVDGLDDLQAYNAIVAKLAPRMRVPGSGATSDFEMQNFLKALPGLGKTPGGNEIIANTLDAMQQHKIAAAEIASRAMAGEISPKDAEKELRSLPDPMTLWKKQGKTLMGSSGAPAAPAPAPTGAPVKVTTPDEARKLPKGTKIILPDGSEGVVP